jgi:ketosteroid isomerase-like protein
MTNTTEHQNVGVVNAMTTAIFGQDHDALARLFTDDFELHLRGPVPPAGDHRGVGGLLEAIGTLIELTNGQIELDQQFCVGTDGWAAEYEHATMQRNGRTLHSNNAFVYRFDGDRIAEMWMYFGSDPGETAAFLA